METCEEAAVPAAEEPVLVEPVVVEPVADPTVVESVAEDQASQGGPDRPVPRKGSPQPPGPVPSAAPAVAVASRSRLAKQSPGFGVFARAAAQAAAETPVLDDPYWLPPEPIPQVQEEESNARERLRKVTILALSEAEEGAVDILM
ncbi:unnamed protein product [Symbiodinium natans]|uniref:Uncharacterized protein n=1 Tax=Symbiodinium natans TaxID=878477 RepID=A0A812TSS7_9DINO|nr:unnamed protein product [Symbiodinium natans]